MRKYLLLAMVGLLLLPGLALAAGTAEIGPDHWAAKTMKSLISKGYLSGYEDGTLGSGKAVTRLDFAVAVDKLLKEIEEGKVKALKEDLEGVRKLINEFRNELVDSQSKVRNLDDKIVHLEKQRVVLHEDFGRMTVGVRDLQKGLDSHKVELAKTRTELDKTRTDLSIANSELELLRKDLSTANEDIKASKEMEMRLQKQQRRSNIFIALAFVAALVAK